MTPETGNIEGTLRQEAVRIKDILLEDEESIASASSKIREDHSKTIRKRLGYAEVEPADISDLKDIRIDGKSLAITPEGLSDTVYVSQKSAETTRQARKNVTQIMSGESDRLVVMVGPCSIREEQETLEYAQHVKEWREEYGDELEILMRFHSEKPRTEGREKDWKGFAKDPLLDGSSDINLGLVASRLLMCQITNSGVPLAAERLDTNTPQYTNALITTDILGARNSLDPNGRAYISGTSATGAIKNPPDGDLLGALNGVISVGEKHRFLGTAMGGGHMIVKTLGNKAVCVVLRGGKEQPNYDQQYVRVMAEMFKDRGIKPAIIIDAAHDNTYNPDTSKKEYDRQAKVVVPNISRQLAEGEDAIKGVMIESNLVEGGQEFIIGETDPDTLEYGKSITDPCISLLHTQNALRALHSGTHARRIMKR